MSDVAITYDGQRRCYEMTVDSILYRMYLYVVDVPDGFLSRKLETKVVISDVPSNKGNCIFQELAMVNHSLKKVFAEAEKSTSNNVSFLEHATLGRMLVIGGNPAFLETIPHNIFEQNPMVSGRLTLHAPLPIWQAMQRDMQLLLDGTALEKLSTQQQSQKTKTENPLAATVLTPLDQQLRPRTIPDSSHLLHSPSDFGDIKNQAKM